MTANNVYHLYPQTYVTSPPGTVVTATATGGVVTGVNSALCPDLLRHAQLGVADGPRGRLVRALFWLLRAWPPPGCGWRAST